MGAFKLPEGWKTWGPMPIVAPLFNHLLGVACAMLTWYLAGMLGHTLFTSEAMLAKITWWEFLGVDIILGGLLLIITIDLAKIAWQGLKEFNTHVVVVA